MAERPMNPGDSPCSSEETCRVEEPAVSREPAQADVVVQPNTTCAECKKEMKSPHLLCCLHSVCAECLPGMAVEGQQRIKCGECGDTSTHCSSSSSSKGVENQCRADIVDCVPILNTPLSRYMEEVKVVGKASNQASIPCGNKRCKTPNSPSTVYCTDCSIFMCECCDYGHEVGAFYEDHTVKTLKEMRELSPVDGQQMFSKNPSANTCSRHRGKVLEYCCEQCSLLMCQACAIELRPHKPKHITANPSIAEPHQQSLRTAHQVSVCFGEKCESVEEQLQTELRSVEQTTEASLVGLKTAFQSIHEAVERRKEELHRQITNAAEKKKRAIESRLRYAEKRKKAVASAVSTLEFLLKNSNTHDLLSNKDLIQTHQCVVTSKWCEGELENMVSSALNFDATNQEAVLESIAGFGIVTDGACPEKCRVEPKPDQLQLIGSDPVTLKVVTCDSKGTVCTIGGDKVEAFLNPKPPTPGPAIEARVVDNDNETYSVSFSSVYPAPCLLSIEVNGRDIRGSPFDVAQLCLPNRKLSRKVENIKGPKGHLDFSPSQTQPGNLVGVAVSPKGKIFVTDYRNSKVHVFSADKKYITSFGSQGSGMGQLMNPRGLSVDSDGLVYVASQGNNRIEVFKEDGTYIQQIGSGQLNLPWHVTTYNRNVYIADTHNHRVSVYTLQGQHVRCIGSRGNGPGQVNCPSEVTFSPEGDMYVTDYNNHRVQVFDGSGQYKREFGQGHLKNPVGIVITSDGDVLVADQGNRRVAVFSTTGSTNNLVQSIKMNEGHTIYGLAIDHDGDILVTDYGRSFQVVIL